MSDEFLDWRDRGRCRRGVDPELFFPVGQGAQARAQEAQAVAFCQPCPVRIKCATWAVEVGEAGVWGGLTEGQRRRIRQQRRTA